MEYQTFSRKPPFMRRQYYFRIVAKNGKTIAQSEGYNNAAERDQTMDNIRVLSRYAPVVRFP